MKINKKPIIVAAVFTIAMIIATVLCIILPNMLKKNYEGPVQVSERICAKYDSSYGAYMVRGKIKNVSDDTVTLKDLNGIIIYYDGNKVNSGWTSGKRDIVLAPDEEYNFATSEYGSDGSYTINRVYVTVDGTEYLIYEYDSLPRTLALFFGIFAVIFLIITLTQIKAQKDIAKRNMAIEGLCAQIGGNCAIINASYNDKTESKKNAAKTAGWVVGGILGAIFTGVGVFRVYSGSQVNQFILNENSLFRAVNNSNVQDIVKITNENFPTESITVKKKKITLKCADGKRSIIFMPDKKCPLTVEEIERNLNNIFFNAPAQQPELTDEVAVNGAVNTENDPFDEFKTQESEAAPAPAPAAEGEVAPADGDTPAEE